VLLHLDGVEQRARRLELSTAVAEAKARFATRVRSLTLALASCAVLLCVLLAWFEIGRRERRHEESAVVRRVAGQVSQLVEEARRSPREAVPRWDEAHRLVQSAVESVLDRRLDDPVRREIGELATSVAAERASAYREREVTEQLDAIRDHHAADIAGATLRAEYRAVFAHFGLSLEPGDLEADVARIRRSSIAERLGIALDQYCLQLSRAPRDEAAQRPHLRALAARADPDPLRLKLRAAIAAADAEALIEAIGQADLERAQASTFDLAASHLEALGRPAEAIALYRRGRRLHPSDFVLNHELARMLRSRPDGDPLEALSLMAATVAIHPSSPHTWTDYAVIAFHCGLPAVGEDALDRALELDPEYSRALAWRGKRMSKGGDRHAALSLLIRAVRSQPGNVPAWNSLGALLSWEGFVTDAAFCLRRAARLAPTDSVIRSNLGLGRLKLRDGAGALAHFEEATRLGGPSATLLCSTGYALLLEGRFEAAADAMERGHDLSVGDATWNYPSADWLARIRSAVAIARAPRSERPDGLADQAWVALLGGDPDRAVDLYRRADESDPAALWADAWTGADHPWQDVHLTWAIEACLEAGGGAGAEENEGEPQARRLALRWLGALLDEVEAGPNGRWARASTRRDLLHRLDHLVGTGPADPGLAAARARIASLLEVLSAEFPIRLPG
jgi:tetratricopeptide (TPR) repeat protein